MRPAALLIASLSGLACACSGSAPTGPDATIFCARTIYDPCQTEHDCSDTLCKTLSPTLQICTSSCTTPGDMTQCPMQDGAAVMCGSGMYCEPAAPTACQINPP